MCLLLTASLLLSVSTEGLSTEGLSKEGLSTEELSKEEEDWTVLFEEALVEHNLRGREQRAEELYRRAVQLAPDQPVLHYNLWALLEEGDGRMDEALERSAAAMDALYDRWKVDTSETEVSKLAQLASQIVADHDGALEKSSSYEAEISATSAPHRLRNLTSMVLNDRGALLRRDLRIYEAAAHISAAHAINPSDGYDMVSLSMFNFLAHQAKVACFYLCAAEFADDLV